MAGVGKKTAGRKPSSAKQLTGKQAEAARKSKTMRKYTKEVCPINFEPAIKKIGKVVSGDTTPLGMRHDTRKAVNQMLNVFLQRALHVINDLQLSSKKNVHKKGSRGAGISTVLGTVRILMKGELAHHASLESTKAVSKYQASMK